ncbi:MAG TPA: hypothetical protein VJ885_07570 [Thermoanaerobaculia bacterium]|nr:hypothetical protein [Thermoanaerobaculia bacterium]
MPHYLSMAGLKNTMATAERLSWDNGTRLRPLGILLTMVDYRTKLTLRAVDRLREEHEPLVFAIEIRINTRLAEAPSGGRASFNTNRTPRGRRLIGCWRMSTSFGARR